jgi:hypothetical protein
VTTGFVIATFLITKLRRYKKMPRALLDAIAADAIFFYCAPCSEPSNSLDGADLPACSG